MILLNAERLYLQPSTLSRRVTLLFFLAVIAFYFLGLGYLPLLGPDEPRYAQVAREMFLRQDLITPTLGGHLWFEKPALLYWMMIASYKLFGVSEWSARFPAALSGVLTVAAVHLVARKIERAEKPGPSPGLGIWSAFAAATTLGIIVFSRGATFDILLTMTTAWAIAFVFLYEFEEPATRGHRFLVGLYAFMGLGLLAKGLIGVVIPLGAIAVYYLIRRRLPERKTLVSLLWGIPLTLAVASSWYLPVIYRHGWLFIDEFVLQHQLARYTYDNFRHPGPFYYYLLILPLISLPWTAFLIDGILKNRGSLWRKGDAEGSSMSRYYVFAVSWLLMPIVFFSFSRSKLPGYILPVLPAASLIVGERLSRLASGLDRSVWPLRATALLFLLAAIGVPGFAWRTGELPIGYALLIAAPLFMAGLFVLIIRRPHTESAASIGGATLAVSLLVLYCLAPTFADRESAKRLLEIAASRGYSQTPIYGMVIDIRAPEFYAFGRVVYDAAGEPVMYEHSGQVVAESQRRQDVILVFVPLEYLGYLIANPAAEIQVLGDNGRVALVTVRAL